MNRNREMMWRLTSDVFDRRRSPLYQCQICEMEEIVEVNANEFMVGHIKKHHNHLIEQYTNAKISVNFQSICKFYLTFPDKYHCKLCARNFKLPEHQKYLEIHLRVFHALETEILTGIPAKRGVMKKIVLPTGEIKEISVGDESNDTNRNVVKRVIRPAEPQPIVYKSPIVENYYEKIGDAYQCNLCNRKFVRKTEHILVCHISMAHPLLKGNEETRPEPVTDNFQDNYAPDLSDYFTRFNNRLQCKLCKLLFGTQRHCLSHMKLKHEEILKTLNLKPVPIKKPKCTLSEEDKLSKLAKLNFNPNSATTVTTITFDNSDANNLRCDFFEKVGDRQECLICEMHIKTTNISHLLKHLRMQHSIFHLEPGCKTSSSSEPPVKRSRKEIEVQSLDKTLPLLDEKYEDPSLSENDPDYVWNFFETTNGSVTCMCCGSEIAEKSHHSLMKHLHMMHDVLFDYSKEDELEEQNTRKSLNAYYYKKGKPLKAERTLVSFLISNGVSYDALDDPSFHHIQHALSRSSSLSTPAFFDVVVDELSNDIKKCSGIMMESCLTATVDFCVHEDEVYMALSLHHFGEEAFRHSNVFLKRIVGTQLNGKNAMLSVQKTLREYNYDLSSLKNIVITNIFSSKIPIMEIENILPCVYEKLTDFADQIMYIPAFRTAIEKLYTFFVTIQNDLLLHTKFELIQKAKGIKFDLSQLKRRNWQSVIDCIQRSIKDPEAFAMLSTFARRWKLRGWLSLENIRNLSTLFIFFQRLQNLGKQMCLTDSMISIVIPSLVEISDNINRLGAEKDIERDMNNAFKNHLNPFFENYCNNLYDISTYLDPRYSQRSIVYPPSKWSQVETKLKESLIREAVFPSDKSQSIYTKTAETRSGISPELLELNREVAREVKEFLKQIHVQRCGMKSFDVYDWWASNRMRFPLLYKKAMDCLSIPACTLDADYYFGSRGKLSHLITTLTNHQLANALVVVSKNETFRGRGARSLPSIHEVVRDESPSSSPVDQEPSTSNSITHLSPTFNTMSNQQLNFLSDKAPPLPPRIANMACARTIQAPKSDAEKLAMREAKRNEKRMKKLDPSRFIVKNEKEVYDFEEYLMVPPPPVLEQMVPQPPTEEPIEIETEARMGMEVEMDTGTEYEVNVRAELGTRMELELEMELAKDKNQPSTSTSQLDNLVKIEFPVKEVKQEVVEEPQPAPVLVEVKQEEPDV